MTNPDHPTVSQALAGRGAKIGLLCGAAYGLASRLVLSGDGSLGTAMLLMTGGFLFVVPIVIGYLTVRPVPSPSPNFKWFGPWVSCLLVVAGSVIVGLEGAICVILALPMMLALSSVGGLIGASRAGRSRAGVPIAFLLPWVVMGVEPRGAGPVRLVTTTTSIAIDAPVSAVWPLVVSVDSIRPDERRPALFTAIGFPRPVAATLDRPGVGGVRTASFERGVVFHEAVTAWEPERLIRFTIDAKDVPSTALDPHVTIGGPFFDVLDGTYELQPLASGGTLLVLRSEHRVSTRFNFYAGWWSDRIMRSIQRNILDILKARAEHPAPSSH